MQTLIKEVKWLLKYTKLILELGTVSGGSDLTVETTSLGELHSLTHSVTFRTWEAKLVEPRAVGENEAVLAPKTPTLLSP